MSELTGSRVGDYLPSVDELPLGFKAIKSESRLGSIDIQCIDCGISAV